MISILVVDDEPGILSICKCIFENEKYTVHLAKSGEEAIDFLNGAAVDIALLDLRMPRIGGIDLLKKIKKTDPAIEVIMMTADNEIEAAIESLKQGAFDYVIKPFEIDTISDAVDKAAEYISLRARAGIYRDITEFYKVYHTDGKSASKQELLNRLLGCAAKALRADSGSIMAILPNKRALRVVASLGADREEMADARFIGSVAGWVAKEKAALLIQDGFSGLPQFSDIPVRLEIASSMVSSLQRSNKVLGVMCLNRMKETKYPRFTKNELDYFKIYAMHASIIMDLVS